MVADNRLFFPKAFLLSFFLLLTTQLSAQSTNKTVLQSKDEPDILVIRQSFQRINALKLRMQRFTYESAGCAEEGIVKYYFHNKEIVKISESGSIGDGSWLREYYYDAGKVIFCLESLVGGPAVGPVTRTQYRYYVKDGHPIRVMDGNKMIPADSKASEMLQTAHNIYEAYTTKDFVSALCN